MEYTHYEKDLFDSFDSFDSLDSYTDIIRYDFYPSQSSKTRFRLYMVKITHKDEKLIFINNGRIILDEAMADLADTYTEVLVDGDKNDLANSLHPIYVRELLGQKSYTFEGVPKSQLEQLGDTITPSVADLFVAKMKEEANE